MTDETEETADGEANADEDASAEPAQEAETETAEEEPADQQEEPHTIPVNYMGEARRVTEQEAVPLIQMGMDYGRVRQKYDEAKPVMDLMTQLAQENGCTVPEFTQRLREARHQQNEGMSQEEARRAVQMEDREAYIRQREEEAARQQSAEARKNRDLNDFRAQFPEAAAKPESIPQEVWNAVRNGQTLTSAYGRWALEQSRAEVAQLKEQQRSDKANQENRQRTTGSMGSTGSDLKTSDPFLEGWNEG